MVAAQNTRLDRKAWLEKGLDTLYEEGIDRVKVEPLARQLGVTKGSFYWHFKSRLELLRGMLELWEEISLAFRDKFRDAPEPDGEKRLQQVVEFIHRKDARHDIGVRTWARFDPMAGEFVARVDRARLDYARAIFAMIGFSDDEARLRARILYFYQVGEQLTTIRDDEPLRDRLAELRTELLTRRG